jgi:hypothetical protein
MTTTLAVMRNPAREVDMKSLVSWTSIKFLVVVAALAGFLLAAAGTPNRAEANAANVLCNVFTLGIASALGACITPFGTTPADPTPVPTQCTPPRLTGFPQFLRTPPGTAKYLFDGTCSNPAQLPGAQLAYRWEGSWSPSEQDPNKPNASESITITGYEPFIPDRAPGGRLFMYWTARCNRDPWLSAEGASCQRLGAFIPDDLRQVTPDLQATSFPRTRDAIPANDRPRLYAEYQRFNSPAKTRVLPGVLAPVTTNDMFTITKPGENDRVVQGQMIVAAMQPKVGMTPVTELEFRWLDAPNNQPYVNTFVVDTPKLLQGYPVDPRVTRGNVGRWEVRARISGQAVPGPWSLPVRFQLLLTQPTQSQPFMAPQTTPLPSSSVVQPPPQGGGPATQMIVPPTAPSQRRLLIQPRGTEGQGGTEGEKPEEKEAQR